MASRIGSRDGEGARALRAALTAPTVDILGAAAQARALFAVADPVRARWIDLEMSGYDALSSVPLLHDLLGVPPGHDLARSVADYRTQVGRAWSSNARRDTVMHFFVEPLAQIVAARDQIRASNVTGLVELAFVASAGVPPYPGADFPADVFERILHGVVAALSHELRALAR